MSEEGPETTNAVEARSAGPPRYKYVVERQAEGAEDRQVQAERALALERAFKGEELEPPPFVKDLLEGEEFFMKGRERQKSGEVKNLIPDKYFDDEEVKKEIKVLLSSLKEGKSLNDIISEDMTKDGELDVKKLEALKLLGARLLQEHHPDEKGVKWKEISEIEKRTVRMAEMMVHAAEMGALSRRLKNRERPLSVKKAEVFERNYSRYAQSVDLPMEHRNDYEEVVKRLRVANTVVDTVNMVVPTGGEAKPGETKAGPAGGGEVLGEKEPPKEGGSESRPVRAEAVKEPDVSDKEVFPEQVEYERKMREHGRELAGETEGVSVFDMNKAQLQERVEVVQLREHDRRNSDDQKMLRGQEIVDGGLEMPKGEVKALREVKTEREVKAQKKAWREQLLERVGKLISEGVEAAGQSDPEQGRGLKKYEDIWLNEFGLDSAQARGSLTDKLTTKWTETVYRRLKVGTKEEVMEIREDFVKVLRGIAESKKVTGEAETILDSLADRFELMNLRDRLNDIEKEEKAAGKVAETMEEAEGEVVMAEIVPEVLDDAEEELRERLLSESEAEKEADPKVKERVVEAKRERIRERDKRIMMRDMERARKKARKEKAPAVSEVSEKAKQRKEKDMTVLEQESKGEPVGTEVADDADEVLGGERPPKESEAETTTGSAGDTVVKKAGKVKRKRVKEREGKITREAKEKEQKRRRTGNLIIALEILSKGEEDLSGKKEAVIRREYDRLEKQRREWQGNKTARNKEWVDLRDRRNALGKVVKSGSLTKKDREIIRDEIVRLREEWEKIKQQDSGLGKAMGDIEEAVGDIDVEKERRRAGRVEKKDKRGLGSFRSEAEIKQGLKKEKKPHIKEGGQLKPLMRRKEK